jgi:hypothetical protein
VISTALGSYREGGLCVQCINLLKMFSALSMDIANYCELNPVAFIERLVQPRRMDIWGNCM